MGICFVDCETTGLDPVHHQIWEVGLITPDGREHLWQFPVADEMACDPFALEIGRYWERRWDSDAKAVAVLDAIYEADTAKSRRVRYPEQGRAIAPSHEWCRYFRTLTAGHHLAGAVVSFDEERLRRLLHRFGTLHRWHYHLIDVEALAFGYLAGTRWASSILGNRNVRVVGVTGPPWDLTELSVAIGVHPDQFDRHTALGDARWAKAIYEKVMGDA